MHDAVVIFFGMMACGAACYQWGRYSAEHACYYHRQRADRLAKDLAMVERERDSLAARRMSSPPGAA